jgi:4-amino-4-deoxy-L-arabinose transferase-like glycosyltransferase
MPARDVDDAESETNGSDSTDTAAVTAPGPASGSARGSAWWKPSDPRFAGALALAAVVGVALRVLVVVVSRWDVALGQDDAGYYAGQARLLRQGHGFIEPFLYAYTDGRLRSPSATHPPLFSLLLALADLVGFGSVNGMRLVSCAIGGAAIVLVGLLGRELAGRRAGMIAGGIAALYPIWWLSDSLILSEVLYVPLVAATLLLAYRLWRQPTPGRAVGLGVVGALAALTRSEGLLLLALVAGCVVVLCPRIERRRRIQLVALTGVAAVLTISPWIAYNASRFDRVVTMSTNDGATFADANCPATYSGRYLGLYVFQCHVPSVSERGDESERAHRLADVGIQYARDHADRVPVVVAARVGRVWGVFGPVQTIDADAFGRWSHRTSQFMVAGYWLVAVGGLAGFVVLRRRGVPISPLVASIVAVTITAAVTYGIIRFRVPGDVVFVALSAVTVDALLARGFPARRRAEPDPAR